MKRIAPFLALASAAALLAGCATSESEPVAEDPYPEESITLIMPSPAGSGPDASVRVVAQELEAELGVSVIVENVEGGSSTIGLFEMASSDPDGYTIGWGATNGISIASRLIDTPFEGLATVTPLARILVPVNGLFGAADRWASIDEFIEEAQDRPGELTVGIPNPGSIQDIQLALLEEAADIDVQPVYFDAGQQVLPVVNGTVDAAIAQPGPVIQYVQNGDLSWVGFFGDDLPDGIEGDLFNDAGYDTNAFSSYEGIFAPAGIPENVLQRLDEALGVAILSDAYADYAAKTSGVVAYLNAADFAAEAQRLDEETPSIIEELGLGG